MGVFADEEAMRSGLKMSGLTDSVYRRTYGVARSSGMDGEPPELVSSDDEDERRVQATTRGCRLPEAPTCPECFTPGIPGCFLASLKFRAAYFLLRNALAPQLLEVLLKASREALNARPSTRPTLQASRAERWFGHQSYVGMFLHAPGIS